MDTTIRMDTMKRYARRRDKNLGVLMEMAERLRVAKPIRHYLEVLL